MKVGTQFPNSPLWLNFANNTKLSIVDKALKVEFEPDGNFGIGNPTVNLRAENGEPTYKYLVIRIKGEKGNENRTAVGGLIVSIGGAEGSHMRSLNDREVGIAIPALDKNGNVMPAITTQFQNFVIPLTKENVRPTGNAISINFNYIVNKGTIYIDDIYLTNTYPSDADEYKPTKAPTTKATEKKTDSAATTIADTTKQDTNDTSRVADTTANQTESTEYSDVETGSTKDATPSTENSATTANTGSSSDGGISVGAMIAIVIGIMVVVGGGLVPLLPGYTQKGILTGKFGILRLPEFLVAAE